MINIQLTYHGHPIYQICFLNTVMPVALTLTEMGEKLWNIQLAILEKKDIKKE